jgi:uncharacterized protein YecE (DUF72 family)
MEELKVGCAGWSVPKSAGDGFPIQGSHLERYASVFPCVEINSCFYRSHQPKTYLRWAGTVPARFRFSVKLPKEITHKLRLRNAEEPLHDFLEQVGHLGPKLGPILIQLPPSFAWSETVIDSFLKLLRNQFKGQLALEPRHRTWFVPDAEKVLESYQVARVAADPAVLPEAAHPGGWTELVYYRLHGSPKMYYSAYSNEYLTALARQLADVHGEAWCIFDNTALGAATENALHLLHGVHA